MERGTQNLSKLRVGDIDDGISIDGKARELLKAVYLKPLRDAEFDTVRSALRLSS